jgi:hypothetical protein
MPPKQFLIRNSSIQSEGDCEQEEVQALRSKLLLDMSTEYIESKKVRKTTMSSIVKKYNGMIAKKYPLLRKHNVCFNAKNLFDAKNSVLNGKPQTSLGRRGPSPKISSHVMTCVAQLVRRSEDGGRSLSKTSMHAILQPAVQMEGVSTVSRNTVKNALEKHGLKFLSVRKIEGSHAAAMSENNVKRHFDALSEIFSKYPELQRDPRRIINTDETECQTNWKSGDGCGTSRRSKS